MAANNKEILINIEEDLLKLEQELDKYEKNIDKLEKLKLARFCELKELYQQYLLLNDKN